MKFREKGFQCLSGHEKDQSIQVLQGPERYVYKMDDMNI